MIRAAIAAIRRKPSGSPFPFMQTMVNEAYSDAVLHCGALPFLIPVSRPELATEVLAGFDLLILPGGGDVSPSLYGEEIDGAIEPDLEMDLFHIALIKHAHSAGIPILGICRGIQIINTAFGGSLYQDLARSIGTKIHHRRYDIPSGYAHIVHAEPGSEIEKIIGSSALTNSLHHQGIKELGKGLRATAHTEDGLIEAIEGENILAVQWHPEAMAEMAGIFSYSIDKASRLAH